MPAQSRLESTTTGTTTAPQTTESVSAGADNSTQQPATYTVAIGDSLWKIAQRILGNGGRYMEIYEANRDSLSSPGAIRVGQQLLIPGAAPVVASPTVEEQVEAVVEAGSQEQEEVLNPTLTEQAPEDDLAEYRSGSGALGALILAAGSWIEVTSQQLTGGETQAWETIARDHGMSQDWLIPFNQHVQSVSVGGEQEVGEAKTPALAAGVRIYIPSAAEILLAQCRKRSDTLAEAVKEYATLASDFHLKMMETARQRASGSVGVGYGTPGDGGVFYTQNPAIAGASKRRTSTLGGEEQYRVNWGQDFWKCSVFLNDVAFSAGYKPDTTENGHYRLAGQLHWSKQWEEVSAKDAAPGCGWQRFGGTGSNESHNAILSSFVDIADAGDDYETWTFTIIGAESERAAESDREHTIKKGTNENTNGQIIRFFKPKYER